MQMCAPQVNLGVIFVLSAINIFDTVNRARIMAMSQMERWCGRRCGSERAGHWQPLASRLRLVSTFRAKHKAPRAPASLAPDSLELDATPAPPAAECVCTPEEERQARKLVAAIRLLLQLDYLHGMAAAAKAGAELSRTANPRFRQAGEAILKMLPGDARPKASAVLAAEALSMPSATSTSIFGDQVLSGKQVLTSLMAAKAFADEPVSPAATADAAGASVGAAPTALYSS